MLLDNAYPLNCDILYPSVSHQGGLIAAEHRLLASSCSLAILVWVGANRHLPTEFTGYDDIPTSSQSNMAG